MKRLSIARGIDRDRLERNRAEFNADPGSALADPGLCNQIPRGAADFARFSMLDGRLSYGILMRWAHNDSNWEPNWTAYGEQTRTRRQVVYEREVRIQLEARVQEKVPCPAVHHHNHTCWCCRKWTPDLNTIYRLEYEKRILLLTRAGEDGEAVCPIHGGEEFSTPGCYCWVCGQIETRARLPSEITDEGFEQARREYLEKLLRLGTQAGSQEVVCPFMFTLEVGKHKPGFHCECCGELEPREAWQESRTDKVIWGLGWTPGETTVSREEARFDTMVSRALGEHH